MHDNHVLPKQSVALTAEQTLRQAIAHHQAGRLQDAERLYRAILQVQPNHPDANHNLGVLAVQLKQPAVGLPHFKAALEANPAQGQYWLSYADALLAVGQAKDALNIIQHATQRGFDTPAVQALRQKAEAAMLNSNAPTPAEISQLAALFNAGNHVEVERRGLELLQRQPESGFVWKVLGASLQAQAKDSLPAKQKATELTPDDAEAHYNLGNALQASGQLDDAVASYRRALEVRRDFAEAYSNLGNAMKEIGQHDDAVASYRRALELKPDYAEAHGNLLFTLNYHPDLSAQDIYQTYREFDAQWGIPLRPAWRAHSNDKNPDRRLRVAYVSPDFRRHSCRSFLEPLLAHHDKTRVEVYAYAELAREDEVTARYRGYVEHWVPTRGMSDEALAERIRSDGIDILVELAGHTADNRLLAFARKPAPVSVSWLGYGYTTGLGAIDYYLTDDACVPTGSEALFAEQPWRIATPAYAYRPSSGMGEVNGLPAQQRGHITFGTLTRSVRINHRTVRVWAEILRAVSGSRLVIDSLNFKDPAMRERMAARFAEHGIARERLEIGFHSPPWDVLRGIDIGLDCFPHNSGTTLFETLYMGVPYITLAGRPSVGRLGSSILQGVGHPEWIAASEDGYVAKAAELAGDVVRLSEIRATLRGQMEASPLRDEAGFARKVEAAYRGMWKDWCSR